MVNHTVIQLLINLCFVALQLVRICCNNEDLQTLLFQSEWPKYRYSIFITLLNSSPIDELGNWCPTGWRGARAIQAQQGGIHGNPASGNRPLKRPPTDTVTLKKASVDNTYLNLYLRIPTDHEGREGWGQDFATICLNKALEKAGNQQQAVSNWSATISKIIKIIKIIVITSLDCYYYKYRSMFKLW